MVNFDGCEKKGGEKSENRALLCSLLAIKKIARHCADARRFDPAENLNGVEKKEKEGWWAEIEDGRIYTLEVNPSPQIARADGMFL